jgi:hypothetical protein
MTANRIASPTSPALSGDFHFTLSLRVAPQAPRSNPQIDEEIASLQRTLLAMTNIFQEKTCFVKPY